MKKHNLDPAYGERDRPSNIAAFEVTPEAVRMKLKAFPVGLDLAIVGSTRLTGDTPRHLIRLVLVTTRPKLVVSGGAEGIDTVAEEIADAYGIPKDIHRPTRQQWGGPGGFRDRNLRIAERCQGLVRIPWVGSTTYGSGWTRDRAAELGKPTAEFWLRLDPDVPKFE